MSKARELANLGNAYSDGALSNRNLIINGAMQVAQRGVSHSVSAGYTLDRWFIASSVTATVTKEEDTVGGRKVSVIKSSASGSTYNAILQRIEGMRRIQGQTLTVSAWVKGAAGTETQYVEFRDSSGTVISNVTENFTFDGNWQKFEWTFEAPTNASFDNDAAWFNVSFYGGDELSVTMAQLEVGDTATPFEHRSYGDELAKCQRYFQKQPIPQYVYPTDAGQITWMVPLSVPLRASPSISPESAFYAHRKDAAGIVTIWDGTGSYGASVYDYEEGEVLIRNNLDGGVVAGMYTINASSTSGNSNSNLAKLFFDAEL